MDPVGSWSAYASYNRLAGVQASTGGGELHHLTPSTPTGAPPTTTATSLISGGFLSPPPVGYETVFSPLFHHAGAKPSAHYVTQVTQHRQALAQAQAASKHATEGEYHQGQAFFEPGATAWQQNSPFGILPHESVVPSTTAGKTTTPYENFNTHFAAAQSLNHLNSQLAATKNVTTRAQSPQITNASAKTSSQTNSANFFQVPVTFPSTDITNKFATTNASNLQQSCIVSSSISSTSKDYRVPQATNRTAFLTSPTPSRSVDKSFVPPPTKQTQIQTKAQTKIYPELSNHADRQRSAQPEETQNQSSPVSFSIMDASSRLNYASNITSVKRPPFQHSTTYRHYQPGNNTEADFQRAKTGADYNNSNGPDCNVVVPRRPSPLQAHSQASPLGHAPSPAYPMYNSPMNSMSSPQQSSNQLTPPSPLDVTVSRPNSQTGNVAYPSVITRALNSEKNFPDRYERSAQQPNSQSQSCWEERQVQQRKFQPQPSPLNTYNSAPVVESARQVDLSRGDQTQQRQPYFDSSHQVSLQDLSSCRGDPMSIVKNLQQQQSCQVQQQISDTKQESKTTTKRRKSSDKISPSTNNTTSPSTMTEYFTGRVPPPAHSTTNPQQQNGTYFDFDRWNLPPSTTKMFASQAMHQQHQGLMVPHPHPHHPPPPLPYFAPFHLPPHPSEYPTSVDATPMAAYNEQSSQQSSSQFLQQEEPKVVVPNIEEELNFLSVDTGGRIPSSGHPRTATNKSDKPTGPGAGFMNSYLKFLQGERDTSPPPAAKGARKQTWSRAKPCQPNEMKQETNGVPVTLPPPPATMRLSQGDPQDDPRYFPLPKERKRNCFDSSDDGFSSDEDLFNKKVALIVKSELSKEKPMRKGRPPKPGGPTERKRARQKIKDDHEIKADIGPVDNLPRRESTKRAAKEKSNFQQLMAKQGDEDIEEPPEFVDSDSDPAWTPQARDDMEEELMHKRGRKSKHGGKKRAPRNLISAAAQGAGIHETDSYNDMIVQMKKQKAAGSEFLGTKSILPSTQKQSVAPTLEDNIAAAVAQQNSVSSNVNDDNPFKPGEFVVIKNELNEEWPAIWRVDGKTLLQKYEPFEQSGETLYRNISTYTSWTPESKKQYIPIPVKYRSQGQLETIVEFLRNELVVIDPEFLEKVMAESDVYQDNFEVYIQTLISQALDSNFLMEIFQEQDEYFLTNVQTIDDITNNKRQKMITLLRWPNPVQTAVTTWPCFNVIREVNALDAQLRPCAGCLTTGVSVRVLMYGQPYNSTTLEGCQPNMQILEKDFLMCRICASRVELFNKITHQKYLMYVECAKRVAEKRATDPHKDTTCILNELLADEYWLTQLFCEVRKSWAEVDCLENSYRLKNSVQ
ncbi:hypothetical protein RI129_007318 [Pyrocoelia pectoralis]|uniref:DUF4211 domain-containing protein n=1 Tax=Pyrocoelia pectoralis TaxID=417401 RepID=A0AAN7VDU8_9COLE